jgi:hypothetical protein
MKTKYLMFAVFSALSTSNAWSQDGLSVPIDVVVDTGSHTCSSIGQDHNVPKEISAGESRYFINENLTMISNFGRGACTYERDGGVQTKIFCVTDADGKQECLPRIVKVIVRAYADCTMDPLKLTTRVGTECRFTATSKRGNLKK